MNEYTFWHGAKRDGDFPDHLTIPLDKPAALDLIRRLAIHLQGDAPYEVSFVGELTQRRIHQQEETE